MPRWSMPVRFGLLCLAIACAIVCLAVLPQELLARAGGGGGYSGGGGGGGGGFGGGGGGGGGDGGLVQLLIWLCLRHPAIGIPLVLAIVAFLVWNARNAETARRGRVIRRGTAALNQQQRSQAVAALQTDDPAFDETRFYDRVGNAFVQIQDAWSRQAMGSVRAFVSDGIYERFSLQFVEQQDFGYRPQVTDVQIHETRLGQVDRDPFFDVITVRIRASCVAFRVSLTDGRYVSGNRNRETFVEHWSFLRRRGVRTQEQPGLIEGHCPNCGAEIRLNQSAKCSACDSVLRSGQYDWVMCEITQDCEWRGGTTQRVPGVEAYRSQHDPGFNVQHLEDRASVVFWRKVMADRLGQIDPLAKMASPEFCEPYASTLTALDGSRRYVGDCAVGSVDVRGVLSKPPRDAVLVEIRWSGTEFVAERGQPPKRSKRGLAVRQLFVFGRNSGVVTDVGSSVSSSHCPGCGAPESDLTSNACQFCGEVLNDGSHDWVLDQILAMNSPEAQQWLRQLAAETVVEAQVIGPATGPVSSQADEPPRGKELLIWMVKMALADQQLDDRERKLLVRMAENQQVPLDELNALVLSAEQGTLEAPTPANREQGREWLVAMADMSVRDGKVQAAEYQMLRQVGAKLNWTDYDIKRLLRERHTRMYQAARQDLRAARSARSTGESHAT